MTTRPPSRAWLLINPTRAVASWIAEPETDRQHLRWAYDGKEYSASGLALKIYREVCQRRRPPRESIPR